METVSPLDPDSCYRAVTARDVRFDGLFFTAVKTTGIYCRPVCPARRPHRRSCLFFETPVAAERAGFRPCLRCRPELAPGLPELNTTLAQAILVRLQSGALDEGTVETLAADIGLSSRQIRRIMLEHFGVTPVEVAQTQRLLFAKKLLQETDLPIVQVALSSGFGSLRRFNSLFRERYRLSPTALRRASGAMATDAEGTLTLRLAFRPPFAWEPLRAHLAARATPAVECVDDQGYWRTVTLDASAETHRGWLRVCPAAKTTQLEVTLSASLAPVLLPITHRLRALFDLDADPMPVGTHLVLDSALRPLVHATPGLRVAGAWDPFELALRAVLGQQISVAGATTLSGRLAARFGTPIATANRSLSRLAPTSARLARASVDDIAAIGLPRARATTVRELAVFAAKGGLSMRPGASLDEMVAAMLHVPGIGPWTAQYVALRGMRHPDAFPAGDLGLRKAMGALDGHASAMTEKTLSARSDAWRPWRAYAAAYLWDSLRKG